ncbi:MAG: UDP-N-acetylglucosamine 1-carboxyvinyltransferase [Candidatus Omnitrophota bacterium]|jgi:UDP-N-acetylglucosamine 1-carboxyvinyltransferase
MDSIVINGPTRLKGSVKISGAKNSILPIMAATVMAKTPFILRNVPNVSDVRSMVSLLKALGAKVEFRGSVLKIDPKNIHSSVADYDYVKTMRASICLLGPLLARFNKASISMPGGCVIGLRPIDLHLKGLKKLGAKITLEHGYVNVHTKGLVGQQIYLGGAFGSSVLATANIMMAASRAKGKTTIVSAACEPEVVDLGHFLIKMGAKIEGLGSPVITITGVKQLKGCEYSIISDRIEAGTYILAAAITRGDVVIQNAPILQLGAVIDELKQAGVGITVKGKQIHVKYIGALKPMTLTTHTYPGFPTDLQAQMMALLAVIPGISVLTEKIFPDRFMHVAELGRMGALIRLEGPSAIIEGVSKLSAAPVMASDLRASAALIIAGLASKGETEISRVYHLDRGYEKLEEKLRGLGAKIKRIKS